MTPFGHPFDEIHECFFRLVIGDNGANWNRDGDDLLRNVPCNWIRHRVVRFQPHSGSR